MLWSLGKWIYQHFAPEYFFTPYAQKHHAKLLSNYATPTLIGHTDVYIFGIRIARIQRTKPWK